MLAVGLKDNKIPEHHYALALEHNSGLEKLENLVDHHSIDIWNHAAKILKTFWPEATNDENAIPNITMGGTYGWNSGN